MSASEQILKYIPIHLYCPHALSGIHIDTIDEVDMQQKWFKQYLGQHICEHSLAVTTDVTFCSSYLQYVVGVIQLGLPL